MALDLDQCLDRDRTPSIPGQELAGVVTALGYGTTGLSVGQRVFGLSDSYRGGTLAEYVAVEARNLAPLRRRRLHGGRERGNAGPDCVAGTVRAWPSSGGAERPRARRGRRSRVDGDATRTRGRAYVIGTGRAAARQTVLDFGAQEFVDLDNDALEDVGEVNLVFDVIGGDIGKRSAGLIRAGEHWCPSSGRPRRGQPTAWRSTLFSCPIAPSWVNRSTDAGRTTADEHR